MMAEEFLVNLGFELENTGGNCLGYTKYTNPETIWEDRYFMVTTPDLGKIKSFQDEVTMCKYENAKDSAMFLFKGSVQQLLIILGSVS